MTVVVGYVPTPEGGAALDEAIAEAGWRSAKLIVVNIALGANFAEPTFADEKDLDAVRARLERAGLDSEVRQITDVSSVADTLVAVLEAETAELVVLALRRTSAVGKLLLGSTVQDVLRAGVCPVLIVRPQQW